MNTRTMGIERLDKSWRERGLEAYSDEKLALAREAAAHPRFDEEAAFEVGIRVVEALEKAGRYPELESVLDAWKERAPEVHDSEPAVLAWRGVLALMVPGRDVAAALIMLATVAPSNDAVEKLAEWSLFRGRVKEAWAGLEAAWPRVKDDEALFGWALQQFANRFILTTVDAALVEEPDMPVERLRERLAPFDELEPDPRWIRDVVVLRPGQEVWKGSPESFAGISREALHAEQWALAMALEPELLARHGWPRGRTQLVHPELVNLMPEPPGKKAAWKAAGRPAALLLPKPEALERWAKEPSDDRYFHPHVHAATALALLPWGDFLLRLGLVDEAELAGWRARVPGALAALPESLGRLTDDPTLAGEVRQGLLFSIEVLSPTR